jgi:hypothetical protein
VSVTAHYACDGCSATAEAGPLLRRFEAAFSGRSYGFGRYVYDTVESVAPAGWMTFDPYTGCCYCPDCWSSIVAESDRRAAVEPELREATP